MDFLKFIAFPQSLEHIAVLHLALKIVYALFLPYVSVLFGASILSLIVERAGSSTQNPIYSRFARELIHAIIPNKSSLLLFGFLPFLSLVLAYAQLLQNTENVAVGMMFFGLLLFTAALGLLFMYQYTFRLNSILALAVSAEQTEGLDAYAEAPDDLDAYAVENIRLHQRAGIWGAALLTASLLLLVCGIAAATTPAGSETIWDAIFSLESLARIGQFAAASGMLTGAAIIFLIAAGKKADDVEYTDFVRKFSINLTLISTLIQPVFILFVLAVLPETALTGSVFGLSALVLVLLFFAGHFLYAMLKNFSGLLAGNILVVLLVVVVLTVVKDQIAFGSATNRESALLAARFDKDEEETMARIGLGAKPLTGEEIFSGRCSACHTFDVKKIGPPYKETLPKYENKRDELTAFILNPRKMNPAYPPMPNQGLKPAEADSIAAYIMKNYKLK